MSMFNRYRNFPQNQVTLTPSDTVDIPNADGMMIEAGSDGTIVTQDKHGRQISRTVKAGAILPVLVKRVLATGTTVSPVIGLY